MRSQDLKALGCISFLIGAVLSVAIPIFFISVEISGAAWIIFAPGWVIFRVGHADLVEMAMATILDTVLAGGVLFGLFMRWQLSWVAGADDSWLPPRTRGTGTTGLEG